MKDIERIAIVDLADDLQIRKQRIFKILNRLGIHTTKRREPERGNQFVAVVTRAEANAIRAEIERPSGASYTDSLQPGDGAVFLAEEIGFFYLIQLEPEHDSGRFKVGFTMDIDGRLRKHRCSAPFAHYVSTWPCKRTWERAAIDCVTDGCEQLHTEVFRAVSLDRIEEKAKVFFSIMPALKETEDEGNGDDFDQKDIIGDQPTRRDAND